MNSSQYPLSSDTDEAVSANTPAYLTEDATTEVSVPQAKHSLLDGILKLGFYYGGTTSPWDGGLAWPVSTSDHLLHLVFWHLVRDTPSAIQKQWHISQIAPSK